MAWQCVKYCHRFCSIHWQASYLYWEPMRGIWGVFLISLALPAPTLLIHAESFYEMEFVKVLIPPRATKSILDEGQWMLLNMDVIRLWWSSKPLRALTQLKKVRRILLEWLRVTKDFVDLDQEETLEFFFRHGDSVRSYNLCIIQTTHIQHRNSIGIFSIIFFNWE